MPPSNPSLRLLEFSVDQASRSERTCLDLDNQCLWLNDQHCELTPKAFQVLHYLATHEQKVLSHQELYEHLWPNTHVGRDNNLKKYIRELRIALHDDAKEPRFIETQSRRGYRFLPAVRVVAPLQIEKSTGSSEDEPLLIERDEQLDILKKCFARSAQGARQLVFVTGLPGIGKSALIAAFITWIRHQALGARYSIVPCFKKEGRRGAYSSLINLFEGLCENDPSEATARSLEENAPSWIQHLSPSLFRNHQLPAKQTGPEIEDPATMIREAARELEFLARSAPLILVLEDMHWSDREAIDFLNALARRDVMARMLVLATFRPSFSDASDVPLRTLKRDLVCHELCVHLRLAPLTRDGIGLYLTRLKGGCRPPDSLIEFLSKNSGGNPFLMRALLESLFKQRLCSAENGEWFVDLEGRQPSMPIRISQFMEIELNSLPVSDLSILEASSVIGDTFCAEEIAAVLEESCKSVQERLAQFARSGEFLCYSKTSPGYCEFTAESLRNILYWRMFPERRKEMHRRFAIWMETCASPLNPSTSKLLAQHFQEAQEWTRAVPYVLLSSDDAGRARAVEQALKLLSRGKE